jgi:hypothetical protein
MAGFLFRVHFKRKGGKIRNVAYACCGVRAVRTFWKRAAAFLSITVYSYKLTQRELEARLESGLTMLPGQLLRFEGVKPAYGKVSEVHALPALVPGTPEGYALLIELLHGTPGLGAQKVTLLSTAQMAREVQKLQPSIEHPLQFAGHFVGELANLGALTLVEGDDFLLKYDALQVVINAVKPYRRLLIIDPRGLFEEGDGFTYLKAGQDVRLSIQQVGSKRFLQAFGELFSPELRVPALRTLADHWPLLGSEGEFVPFSRLLNLEAAVNLPLKNLLVHHYQTLLQSRVFADSPEQTLNLGQALRQPICIVDVSDMPAPWKHLFYEQLCETVFREGGGGLVPVLLYPEKYLPDLPAWAQRAEEVGFNMLVMASPFAAESLRDKANNRVWVDSREAMELKGSLTLGLPVSFPLPMHTWEDCLRHFWECLRHKGWILPMSHFSRRVLSNLPLRNRDRLSLKKTRNLALKPQYRLRLPCQRKMPQMRTWHSQ